MKACLLSLLVSTSLFAQDSRPGIVQFSNGETIEGQLSLTPGSELKMINGVKLSSLTFDRVQEIRFTPETESLEQKYRFPVAGQSRKERWGLPYPLRLLQASIMLADGQTLTGHLYTTVIYVESQEKNEKVILAAKQRGQEGETLQSLVYPASIKFTDTAAATERSIHLNLGKAGEGAVVALTHGALVRLEAHGDRLDSPLGAECFLAVSNQQGIAVGWPAAPDDALTKLVHDALPDVRDFFDKFTLLGVWRDAASGDLFSLMMLQRVGSTTLPGKVTQPWRCEIWRWKYAEEEKRLMVAGRNYFFRGILAKGLPPPTVTLTPKLWNLKRVGDTWTIGDE